MFFFLFSKVLVGTVLFLLVGYQFLSFAVLRLLVPGFDFRLLVLWLLGFLPSWCPAYVAEGFSF